MRKSCPVPFCDSHTDSRLKRRLRGNHGERHRRRINRELEKFISLATARSTVPEGARRVAPTPPPARTRVARLFSGLRRVFALS